MSVKGKGIKLKLLNLEKECAAGVLSGKDFYIDISVPIKKLLESGEFDEILMQDTIYSAKRFGPQKFESDTLQKYAYQCVCGKLYGAENIGEYCHECSAVVDKKVFDLGIVGWIKLPFKVLTPIGIQKLKFAISSAKGSSKVKDVNQKSWKKKKKSNKSDGDDNKKSYTKWERLKYGKEPFKPSDLSNLYENMEEILSPIIKDTDRLEYILSIKENIFTNVIPVISKRLRRYMRYYNGDVPVIKADKLSTGYTTLISAVNQSINGIFTVNGKYKIVRGVTDIMELIYDYAYVELMDSKEKAIKGEIYSTRNPYSARTLVEPDNVTQSGRGDLVRVSYDILRTLHKEHIMEKLINEYDYSYFEADKMTDTDFTLSDEQKRLLDKFVVEEDYYIQINRPPSIDFSAILVTKITSLTDANILYINPIICEELRADFDGDTFSDYVCHMDMKWRMKVVGNPRRFALWWNRTVNDSYGPINDQVVTVHMLMGEGGVEIIED